MYANTKTWNPAVGCKYDCKYCKSSFQRQLKRVSGNKKVHQGFRYYSKDILTNHGKKGGCSFCKTFEPHYHPERLDKTKIGSKPLIFVFAHGDITFYSENYVRIVLDILNEYSKKHDRNFYLQSKNPTCFEKYLDYLNENVVLLTTIETNRDMDYQLISKAPPPSKRFDDFYHLDYHRKVVTIEPIMDFDLPIFSEWMYKLNEQRTLEYIWLGFNSKPKQVQLPEPSYEKVSLFINKLREENILIKGKDLRGHSLINSL